MHDANYDAQSVLTLVTDANAAIRNDCTKKIFLVVAEWKEQEKSAPYNAFQYALIYLIQISADRESRRRDNLHDGRSR